MDDDCYTFQKYMYNDPIFKNTIDATYIINLENNGRLDHVFNQLEKYKPTKIVYIVFNKGYKKCHKQKFIITPPIDLVDAFLTILKHAKKENYDNILILEDDFIFSPDIKKKFNIDNINHFLNKKKNKHFLYYLGIVPFLLIPYDKYNYKNILSLGCHSIIYSKKYREYILTIKQQNIKDWDYFTNIFIKNKYTYYKPLCYQLFPPTENSKHWADADIFTNGLFALILKNILKKLNLDQKIDPGYTIFYNFSKTIFYIFIIIIILILIKI